MTDKAEYRSSTVHASKILWGVCGIGHGHVFRQLPLIEHFVRQNDMVIFGYGESYDFYHKHFANCANVTVVPVAVPFYVGNRDGLDFEATAQKSENRHDCVTINAAAMAVAMKTIGHPDLVISDYEPVSAQYAYACDAPLVTIDQQSKYLAGDFVSPLNGHTYVDETMRLSMFFPKAERRLACSFFQVAHKANTSKAVEICPPVLSEAIINMQRNPTDDTKSILIYVSSQQPFGQSFEEIKEICAGLPDVRFHIFGKNIPQFDLPNLKGYVHGDQHFHEALAGCHGIVTTAGHGLLSEAMYLGIPVYAIPLPLYEQQMNAKIIHDNGFGVSHPKLDAAVLNGFIGNIEAYKQAIQEDASSALLRGPGQNQIISRLQQYLA